MSEVKEKAHRFKRLLRDEIFQEVLEHVQDEQIATFLDPSSTLEDVMEARDNIKSLGNIERVIRSAIDAEAVYDKKQS